MRFTENHIEFTPDEMALLKSLVACGEPDYSTLSPSQQLDRQMAVLKDAKDALWAIRKSLSLDSVDRYTIASVHDNLMQQLDRLATAAASLRKLEAEKPREESKT